MVSINSQHLDEIMSNIRVRPIPWEGYVRANLISATEASLIKSVEKQPKDKSVEIVNADVELYATTVVDILGRITRDDVVKYILSLTGDIAAESTEFSSALVATESTFSVLSKLLERPDEHTHLLASRSLVILVTSPAASSLPKAELEPTVTGLLAYITKRLAPSPHSNIQDIAVQYYGAILSVKRFRPVFWTDKTNVVPVLLKILDTAKNNLQLQYHTLLLLWLSTFEKDAATDVITEFDLVPILIAIVKSSLKEKIIRVSVAIWINAVNLAPRVSIPALLSHSALSLVNMLVDRKWTDDELIDDLNTLKTRLQEAFDSMSTFDEYESEIIGKKLTWSPPHRSDTFWKQNIDKFKDVDWKIVKSLSAIILSTSDTVTLTVGCNDVSRIIAELPESIKVFEKQGVKVKIMELMNHADPDVRYEALRATQTFIAHSFK